MKYNILFFFVSFLLGFISVSAQNPTVSELSHMMASANVLYKAKNYSEAAKLGEQIYAQCGAALTDTLNEKEHKEWTTLYVQSGYFLSGCYMSESYRDFSKARELLTAIEGCADVKSKTIISKRWAQTWSMEAMLTAGALNYEASLPLFSRAAEAYHAIGDAPQEAQMLIYYANSQMQMYQYSDALATLAEASSLSRATGADLQLLKVLKEEEYVYTKMGDSEAKVRVLGTMDSLYAHSADFNVRVEYNRLKGNEAMNQGRYAVAKTYFLANEEYIDRQLPHQLDGFLSWLYGNLRDVCIAEKHYDEALDYAYKTLQHDIFYHDGTLGRKYMQYTHIAHIYSLQGDSASCAAALDTLFLDLPHISAAKEKASLYGNRAICHSNLKQYESALADWLKSDSVLATSYAEDDPERSSKYANIANMFCQLERYDEAERYYRLYADIARATYGEGSDYALYAQFNLANCVALAGRIDEGCRDYVAAIGKIRDNVRRRLPYSSAAERETMWHQCSNHLTDMTAFAIKANRTADDFTRASYEALMLSKAFLLDYERSTFDIVSALGTSDDLNEYTRIMTLNNRLLDLQKAPSKNSEQIVSLSAQVASLERALSQKCKAYGDVTAFMNIDYDAVRQALGPKDVVIDFTDFVHRAEGRKYAAYILNSQQQNPMLVPLFAESSIDSLEVSAPDMYYNEMNAPTLIDLLWNPLSAHISEGATVYYIPSHMLFQIALESLPLPDGSLLGDHYNFVRLSSAREVVGVHDKVEFADDAKRAILYGGLHYDLQPEVMAEEAVKYEVSPHLAMRGDDVRGATRFRDLKETGPEVEAIGSLLRGRGVDVTFRCGSVGTEESFLSLHGHAPTLLHIATHGFYYTPDEASKVDYLKGHDNAMALSGLVFSGGNAAWQGTLPPEGVLGGIMTASNIAAMDLHGVDMVVLSACKTGQGHATSEGLFGLQRAFKKAGVQTIVMTLWNVDDQACREYMEAFYAHLADPANDWDKRKAFETAKSLIRAKYSHPFYWAAFVMLD